MKKRADGRYQVSVVIGYTEKGTPKRRYIYGTSKKEVNDKAAEIRRNLERGTFSVDKKITVREWSEKWLKTYKSGTQYNTYEMYKRIVNNFIVLELGDIQLSKLRTNDIQNLINKKAKEGLTRTLEQIKLTMNQIIKQAIREDYLYKNVVEGVILPSVDSTPKRSLTDAEKELIEKTDFALQEKAFLNLLQYTGLRRGEALALTKNDVDIENGLIHVNKTIIFKGNDAELKPSPKSDAGNRDIPIPKILKQSLLEQHNKANSLYIFPDTKGGLMSKSSFRRFWEGIMDKLNTTAGGQNWANRKKDKDGQKLLKVIAIATDITPHMFRHTYATTLYYAGIDIKTAQYLLGHSSIKVTMDIYTHLDKQNTLESAIKLDNFLDVKSGK